MAVSGFGRRRAWSEQVDVPSKRYDLGDEEGREKLIEQEGRVLDELKGVDQKFLYPDPAKSASVRIFRFSPRWVNPDVVVKDFIKGCEPGPEFRVEDHAKKLVAVLLLTQV